MSQTLLLELPDPVYAALVQTAHQTGQSPEVVATQWLAAAASHAVDDPLEAFIGAFDSHGLDWADAHDVYLGMAHNISIPTRTPQDHAND